MNLLCECESENIMQRDMNMIKNMICDTTG